MKKLIFEMSILDRIIKKNKVKLILLFLICVNFKSYSQTYITWTPVENSITGVSGNFTDGGVSGTVNTNLGTVGYDIEFYSPPITQNNLVVSGNQTFSTTGPHSNAPSKSLTFNFSTPVIVTRFNMNDIDMGVDWNDSFTFGNIVFTSSTSTLCDASVNGVFATNEDNGDGSEFASWFCSTTPVSSYTINYIATNFGLTHAYLGYSLQVLVPPVIGPLCLNQTPPSLPSTIGNGITGTWSPSSIDTYSAGTFNYTFTPNQFQELTCPITIQVDVNNDCCIPNLTLNFGTDDMNNNSPINQSLRQSSDWIRARNLITFGNDILGDGVVYHADNFIELLPGTGSSPGFEAAYGSQFSAYPKECPNNFVYKTSDVKDSVVSEVNLISKDFYKNYSIIKEQNSSIFNIRMINVGLNGVLLYSLDGKCLLDKNFGKRDSYSLDLNEFNSGIYLLNLKTNDGRMNFEKIIID